MLRDFDEVDELILTRLIEEADDLLTEIITVVPSEYLEDIMEAIEAWREDVACNV